MQDRNMEQKMEGEEEVKLLGFWVSTFSHRVIFALELKGIQYKYIEEDITQEKSQLLLEANTVHKKVPILFHRGRAIAESTVILEYIEETWPEKPLMPADPYQRALARFWIKFGDHDVIPIVTSCLIATGEEQEKATKEARESLIVLEEKCLGNNKFFGGDTVGLIDLAFGWLAYCLEPTEIAAGIGTKLMDIQSLPRLSAWAHAFKEVSVIKRTIPDYDKIVSYLIRLREKKLVKP